jgi:hypothetical protein
MRLQTSTKGGNKIASISFNGDMRCLACATSEGYGIFLTAPLERYCFRSFAGGGFSIVEMFGQVGVPPHSSSFLRFGAARVFS